MDKSVALLRVLDWQRIADKDWAAFLKQLDRDLDGNPDDQQASRLVREAIRQDGLTVRHAVALAEFGISASVFLGAPAALASQLLPFIEVPQTSPTLYALTSGAQAIEEALPTPLAWSIRIAVAAIVGWAVDKAIIGVQQSSEDLHPREIARAVRNPTIAWDKHVLHRDTRRAFRRWKDSERALIDAEQDAVRVGIPLQEITNTLRTRPDREQVIPWTEPLAPTADGSDIGL